ncbi:transcription regulator hth gntr [Trichococcus palustris]|jgi:DNA-binding GntR family transcriptional regulator|uniref:Transcription regulator hth gntr n=1 Tax=Trichococcus palustris TaxID=140314 RepID=A0A143YWI0_9LACT|nr:GntR family transcriptional regulator [Trichococcus palustris]CZQ99218.1 transcription regulator hth gntr [Trichococcus palustris]SFK88129.1 DNA-binding transcriptional regulator, GntR family [Trichococcus palustris]
MAEDKLFKKAYSYIKEKIDGNAWPPGTKITEQIVSEALFMSRTPIRKALLLLEDEGWVASVTYKGYVVAEKKISNEGLIERLDLIHGLVGNYLVYLKENDVCIDIAKLEGILEKQEGYLKYRDAAGYFEQEYKLYETFVDKSENQYFKTVLLSTAQAVHGTYSDDSAFQDEERYQSESTLLGVYQQAVTLLKTKSYDELGQHLSVFFEMIKESSDLLAK